MSEAPDRSVNRPMPACAVGPEPAEETYASALEAGARSLAEPADLPYGERQATAYDPWGHVRTLSRTVADVDPAAWGGELLGAEG
mgnify:CR=1 FL=1